jgi:hypothetical protein
LTNFIVNRDVEKVSRADRCREPRNPDLLARGPCNVAGPATGRP